MQRSKEIKSCWGEKKRHWMKLWIKQLKGKMKRLTETDRQRQWHPDRLTEAERDRVIKNEKSMREGEK